MDNTTKLWEEYQDALSWQSAMGFSDDWPENERMRSGDQWPAETPKTRGLPRPVFNVIDFFVRAKKSGVLNQTIKLAFSPAESSDGMDLAQVAQDYTDFAAYTWQSLDQDELNDEAIDEAATNGTTFWHYYWDAEKEGGQLAPYSGALAGEVIDPINLFVGNPQETRLQRQPWIMISNRQSVKAVREMARKMGLPPEEVEAITGDDDTSAEGYDAARHEMKGDSKTTVLTKYYRKNGAVYYDKATKGVMLQEGVPLTPEYYDEDEGEDPAEYMEPQPIEYDDGPEPPRMTLYPIANMVWRRKKKCFFGTGEVKTLIPTQRAINLNIALMLLSVQLTGWPRTLVKPGAIKTPLTNTPGEVTVDYTQGSGDGIKYMSPPTFPTIAINLSDKMLELSRVTSGVNEVSTGEAFSANMAASAIIALQNQAKQPIQNIQQAFFRAMKDVGEIWAQFFRCYYQTPRVMTVTGPDGTDETRVFNGADGIGVEFKLQVDVGPSSSYAESLSVSTLDRFLEMGYITPDQYLELAPKNVVPFREQLKKMKEQEAQMMPQMPMPTGQGVEQQLPQMLQQYQQQLGGLNNALPEM